MTNKKGFFSPMQLFKTDFKLELFYILVFPNEKNWWSPLLKQMQYYFEFLIILIKLQHKILDSYTGADVFKKRKKRQSICQNFHLSFQSAIQLFTSK